MIITNNNRPDIFQENRNSLITRDTVHDSLTPVYNAPIKTLSIESLYHLYK